MPRAAKLSTEILLTLTILLGAALMLGGVLFLRMSEQSLLDERIVQLEAVAKTLGKAFSTYSENDPLANRQSFYLKILRNLPDELHLQDWWLYDQDLQLVTSDAHEEVVAGGIARRQQAKLTLETTTKIDFPSLLELFWTSEAAASVVEPISFENNFIGLLELRFSLDELRYHNLRFQKIILLYVFLYGAVLVGIGYYLLYRNIINPARNLLHATEQAEQGNFNIRLPVAGPIEIAQLAESYNRMVEALLHSRHETQKHIKILEKTNEQLQKARNELIRSEKLASVGQLAAGLAHELGNPLAALIGYLELLKGQSLSEQNLDIVGRSTNEAQRIDYLVRELLDFSRPSNPVFDLIDPVAELKSCLQLLSNQGVFSQLDILDELTSESENINFDRNKLQQVFINILLNAKQACGNSGIIRLTSENNSGQIFISITDNGHGMSKEQINKAFDPFFTTKDPGKGTGLGLAICQRIMDEVGGEILVESTEGQGSAFTLVLNLVPRPEHKCE